jgi:hypothetical protein
MMEECEKKKTAAFVESYCGASAAKAQGSPPHGTEGYQSQIKLEQKLQKALSVGQSLTKEA